MSIHEGHRQEEQAYLKKTLEFISQQLSKEQKVMRDKEKELLSARREMWEDAVHFSEDFDRVPEMNHYLSEVNTQSLSYNSTAKQIEKYKRALDSPYFGRFDFVEEDYGDLEKIYVGLCNLVDEDTGSILIYDWRAPISSIFYQCELGKGSYSSPSGQIFGDISLKRQYKIQHSELKYFFDSSIKINDEILQEVLSRNASSKMRNIVETIQKEQDLIIRDSENHLLMVQGVAGSGKTSIALHRIAFLLYHGFHSKLTSNNVMILSPNMLFSKYISNVLPELGEENVAQITFDELCQKFFGAEVRVESRNLQLETLISSESKEKTKTRLSSIDFKGSQNFAFILDRLVRYVEVSLLEFKDIYYGGKVIESREELKNLFLNNKIRMPVTKRLKRIENMILKKIYPLRKERIKKIEKIVQKSDDHIFEIPSFSRLLSMKESKIFIENLRSFTEVDYKKVYLLLFKNPKLFFRLSKNLPLPNNVEELLLQTKEALEQGAIPYEDCAPLLYLKLKLEGNTDFSDIKQLVIDEAQDYSPLQYKLFRLLFERAKYTILGDYNQSLEKAGNPFLYEEISQILQKEKSTKLSMNKSFRSSYEIYSFAQKILNCNETRTETFLSVERHEEEPLVSPILNIEELDQAILQDIEKYRQQGFESIAILCKTQAETDALWERLKLRTEIPLLNLNLSELQKGVLFLPSYLSKGLEFDVVILYNASSDQYYSDMDKRLLYVSCTRALHRLILYHIGEKSIFLP